jgi:hypothetical protein
MRLITVPPEIEAVLYLYARHHPEDASGIEKVLSFRKRVRAEFDRLVRESEPPALEVFVPKPPPHLKIQRAKTIVDDTGVMVLTECERCGKEKYIVEGQMICDECRSKPGKRKVTKTR